MTPDQVRGRLWARRLKRVFHIDITECEKCRGPVKIMACIEDPVVIEKILAHLKTRDQHTSPHTTHLPPSRAPPMLPDTKQEWKS